jgi:hypothetical protein
VIDFGEKLPKGFRLHFSSTTHTHTHTCCTFIHSFPFFSPFNLFLALTLHVVPRRFTVFALQPQFSLGQSKWDGESGFVKKKIEAVQVLI